MWNLIFLSTGLILDIILITSFFFKKTIKSKENELFKLLTIFNCIGYITEISLQLITQRLGGSNSLTLFVGKLYIIEIFIWFSVFSMYTFKVCSKKDSNEITLVDKITVIAMVIGSLLVFSLKLNGYYDGNKMYSYGPALDFLKMIFAIYILIWIFLLIRNFKNLIQKKFIPIYVILIMLILNVVLNIIDPSVLITTMVGTIICYVMIFTIENPDLKMLNELHKSKEISDNANDEKNLFIYNMTQESRKVTNEINQDVNYILQSDSIDEIKDLARDILNNTAKYSNTTYDILGAQAETTNSLKIYNETYNLKNIIKEIIRINKSKCQEKELEFRTNIDTNIPELLYGDPIILKENINNLIELSINHTEKGYIEFNVNTLIKEDSCRLFISINDSSKGYTSEELNILLKTDKELSKINNHIIKLNGILSITSDLGLGTNTKIILDQRLEHQESTTQKYESILESKRVLLVAYSSPCQKIVEKIFKGSNIKLDIVDNTTACLNNLKINKYDAILIDEELESISGLELRKKLNTVRNFNTKTILLTKDNNYEYNEEYKELGFNDYVLKPLNKNNLLDKLK